MTTEVANEVEPAIDDGIPDGAAKGGGAEPVGLLTWVIVAITLLPIVVVIARVFFGLGASYHATGDNAMNEMRVRDIGTHAVLIGPYSRDGWSHPGPLFYYLSAIPYRLLGSNTAAMLVDALLINGIAIAVIVTTAKRWAGILLAVPVALACATLILSLPNGFLENPWNPYLPVLPFGAFVITAWAAACGSRWAFPVAVFVGTLCMQTHIGYAPLVVVLLAWCVWHILRNRSPRWRSTLGWGAVTLAVLWFPPLLQQLTSNSGNLVEIGRYFLHPPDRVHTISEGWRVVAAQFTFLPDWIVGLRNVSPWSGEPGVVIGAAPIPVLLAPFLVAIVVAFRARRRVDSRLAVALLVSLAASVYAIAHTISNMYEYRLRWVWVLAALATAFTVYEAARLLAPHCDARVRRIAMGAAVAMTVTLASLGVADAVTARPPDPGEAAIGVSLSEQLLRHLPRRPGVVLLQPTSFIASTDSAAVQLYLERRDIHVVIPDTGPNRLSHGDHRVLRGERVRANLTLTSESGVDEVGARPGARLVAYVGKLPFSARAPYVSRLKALLRRPKNLFDPELVRLSQLLLARAVFEFPSSR